MTVGKLNKTIKTKVRRRDLLRERRNVYGEVFEAHHFEGPLIIIKKKVCSPSAVAMNSEA